MKFSHADGVAGALSAAMKASKDEPGWISARGDWLYANPMRRARLIDAIWQTPSSSPSQASIARKNRLALNCRAVGELPLRFKPSQSSFRAEDSVS
jgi:hypothetical protein